VEEMYFICPNTAAELEVNYAAVLNTVTGKHPGERN
jgi:hypothetical protein